MYYELRTYTLDPLKMADWLALYQSHALEVQSEHLGNLVGFFTSEFGDVNQVVHIWGYASLDERIARRAAWQPTRAGRNSPGATANWRQ